MDPSDIRRLVNRARNGDEEAFGELVKTYYQRVYSMAYGFVNNAEDAKDLTQQAWVKAWCKLRSFKEEAGFYTWVYRIAANTCLDFLRRRARQREEALPENIDSYEEMRTSHSPSENPRPDQEVEKAEVRKLFDEALASLPLEHRTTLTLREVNGLSYDEIAKVMKCRKGTVMSRIFYARRKIQERMGGLR